MVGVEGVSEECEGMDEFGSELKIVAVDPMLLTESEVGDELGEDRLLRLSAMDRDSVRRLTLERPWGIE